LKIAFILFYGNLSNGISVRLQTFHGLQINYYEKQLDFSPHQSLFKSLRVIDVGLKTFKCEIVLFF